MGRTVKKGPKRAPLKAPAGRTLVVVIGKPVSPKGTDKTFGIGSEHSKKIDALVEEVIG